MTTLALISARLAGGAPGSEVYSTDTGTVTLAGSSDEAGGVVDMTFNVTATGTGTESVLDFSDFLTIPIPAGKTPKFAHLTVTPTQSDGGAGNAIVAMLVGNATAPTGGSDVPIGLVTAQGGVFGTTSASGAGCGALASMLETGYADELFVGFKSTTATTQNAAIRVVVIYGD